MSNAVIYSRFSSDRQRSESIEQQNKVCEEFCQRMGHTVIRIYSDHALTGRTDARPQFLKMIDDSKKKEFDVVVVYAIDRFSRSVYDSCHYENILTKNGVKLLSATEPLSDDPAGMMVKNMFRSFAEYYSAELSAKIRRGLDDNASKFLCNGKPPYGYDRSKDGRYIVNDAEASIVHEIFVRTAAKERFTDICASLNERGLRTKTGALWTRSSFNKLLSNVRYIGTYVYKNEEFPNAIPAIIEHDLFYQVQDALRSKTNPRGDTMRRRTPNGIYLLTGMLYCGSCGEPMTAKSGTGKHGELHFYYVCNGKKNGSGCTQRNIQRDYIEEKVARALRDIVLDDKTIRWMAENAIEVQNRRPENEERILVERELKEVSEHKNNLLKAVMSGCDSETIINALKEKEKREKELIARLEVIKKMEPELTVDDVISFLEIYREGDIQLKNIQRGLIDAFVTRVDLYDTFANITFTLKKEKRQTVVRLADSDGVRLVSPCGDKNALGEPIHIGPYTYVVTIAA